MGEEDSIYCFRSLVRMFHWTEYVFVLMFVVINGVTNMLQPVWLSFLLPELITPSPGGSSRMFVYATGICFSTFVRALSGHQYTYKEFTAGNTVEVGDYGYAP